MDRQIRAFFKNGSCEKTVPPYSSLLIQKFTPGVIYLHTKFCLHRSNNIRFTVENVARHGPTKRQPRVKGDFSQSPNSLKVNGLAKNAQCGLCMNGLCFYLEILEFFY